jgi:hypothetical protein
MPDLRFGSLADVSQCNRHVRFGSKADICAATSHVRFTPNSDRESGLRQPVMSALPPIADMCGAVAHVGFGPIAGIGPSARPAKAKSRLPQGENKRASKSLLRARRIYMPRKPNGTRYADLQKPPQHHDCEQAPTFRLASELSP